MKYQDLQMKICSIAQIAQQMQSSSPSDMASLSSSFFANGPLSGMDLNSVAAGFTTVWTDAANENTIMAQNLATQPTGETSAIQQNTLVNASVANGIQQQIAQKQFETMLDAQAQAYGGYLLYSSFDINTGADPAAGWYFQ